MLTRAPPTFQITAVSFDELRQKANERESPVIYGCTTNTELCLWSYEFRDTSSSSGGNRIHEHLPEINGYRYISVVVKGDRKFEGNEAALDTFYNRTVESGSLLYCSYEDNGYCNALKPKNITVVILTTTLEMEDDELFNSSLIERLESQIEEVCNSGASQAVKESGIHLLIATAANCFIVLVGSVICHCMAVKRISKMCKIKNNQVSTISASPSNQQLHHPPATPPPTSQPATPTPTTRPATPTLTSQPATPTPSQPATPTVEAKLTNNTKL